VEVEKEKDWCLEVPGNADPMEDQFEKKSEIKAEKVSKNELQRLRNLGKAKKIDIPRAGLTSKEKPSKTEVNLQLLHA
jgi:regulator of ribosome biosynthesis